MSVTIVLTIRVEEWIVSVFFIRGPQSDEGSALLNDLLNTVSTEAISPS